MPGQSYVTATGTVYANIFLSKLYWAFFLLLMSDGDGSRSRKAIDETVRMRVIGGQL